MLTAISPIDGRYAKKTEQLSDYFSEYALIKYRVHIEVEYFIALCEQGLPQLTNFDQSKFSALRSIVENFSLVDATKIKDIEKVTNHDVKAVEYFLKEQFDELGLEAFKEFIHFGLTSQDINNTATPLLIKDALHNVYVPAINSTIEMIKGYVSEWKTIPMLAKTHGQPASPTILGKEFQVFVERLENQLTQLMNVPFTAKFGGATGNFNAHVVSYPDRDWKLFGDHFVKSHLDLTRLQHTTQIAHYDNLASLFMGMKRINTILIDLCRDIWTYISMEYFKQKVIAGEVGSSAMPHKVNPIDFENAEGNLGLANAIFTHLADKLPISRLQRDLTDSTVLRNVGVPFGHTNIALLSIQKGLGKLLLNETALEKDLEANWMVVAEALQNILRREGFPKPYEALKALTRGNSSIDQATIHAFIDKLNIEDHIKAEMKVITPQNYVGVF